MNTRVGYRSIDTEEIMKYPQPLTFLWRTLHNLFYLIGGITFLIGSIQYYPWIEDITAGGYWFTVGSISFVIADGMEWWTNNRVGCFYYENFRESYEEQVERLFSTEDTLIGKWQRATNGLNFFLSFTGSSLYLVGSILFIPSFGMITQGTWIFIFGSGVVLSSQTWKLIRAEFSTRNDYYFDDLPGALVDACAGIGGFNYLIGSVYFLPEYNISNSIEKIASNWFVAGGIFFTLSGIFMFYRYFFTLNYPHEDDSIKESLASKENSHISDYQQKP
eukprot:gene12356-16571_t